MPVVVSAQPLVIEQLIVLSEGSKGQVDGLDGDVTVSDGPGFDGNTGDRLIVGADAPDDGQDTSDFQAASSGQDWAHATGTARNEEGDVFLTAMSWNGNGDVQQARAAVFAIAGTLFGFCVSDYTLGVDVLLWARPGDRIDLTYQTDDQSGVTAVLVFRIHFKARI